MSTSDLTNSPLYYWDKFCQKMNFIVGHTLRYNRDLSANADNKQKYRYLLMVTFNEKNDKNWDLLLPFTIFNQTKFTVTMTSAGKASDHNTDSTTTVAVTNGYARGQRHLYDYFTTDTPIDIARVTVTTNTQLYIEWVSIAPVDGSAVEDSTNDDSGHNSRANNYLYPIFDTVDRGQVVTVERYNSHHIPIPVKLASTLSRDNTLSDLLSTSDLSEADAGASLSKATVANSKYQAVAVNDGKSKPVTLLAPWYEFSSFGYIDNIRYALQFLGVLLLNFLYSIMHPIGTVYNKIIGEGRKSVVTKDAEYKRDIYRALPTPYSLVADFEVLFGKAMVYIWQAGKTSVVPYHGSQYLDLIDPNLHGKLYIGDLSAFKHVKVVNAPGYQNQLFWGKVILATCSDGLLRPVVIVLPSVTLPKTTSGDNVDINNSDNATGVFDPINEPNIKKSDNEVVYTPTNSAWLVAMKRYFDTHITLLFFYHIALIHEFCEFLSVMFKRHIPASHPLYHLYAPFSSGAIASGVYNRCATSTIFLPFTTDTYNQIIDVLYDNFTYDDMCFNSYCSKYGFSSTTSNTDPTSTSDTDPTSTSDTVPTSTSDTDPTSTSDTDPTSTSDTDPTSTSDTVPTSTSDTDPTSSTILPTIPTVSASNKSDEKTSDNKKATLTEVTRLHKLWDVASKYVSTYIDEIYTSQTMLDEDVYVQSWCQHLSSGIYKGFEGKLLNVTRDQLKEVMTIHIFQTLAHWSDHNLTFNILSSPDISLGYDPKSSGRTAVTEKLLTNYILLMANTSKMFGNEAEYQPLLEHSRLAYLENPTLMDNLYSFFHDMLAFERHELSIHNYRDALMLRDIYLGAVY